MDITELAGHALHIMKRWNWDYINPISGHISHNIKLRDALGKLAFDGCTDPESALLQLFCDGSIEAIGDFYWLRYQQKKFYSLSGTQEPIKKEMWSKLRNLREEAKQLYPDQNPDLLKCDLVQLAMQDISKANWGPHRDTFEYAVSMQDVPVYDIDYHEEFYRVQFIEFALAKTLPSPVTDIAALPVGNENTKLLIPLSESNLRKWWDSKAKVRDDLSQDELLTIARFKFPDNHISRDRIRNLTGARKRGPKG